MDPVTPSGLYRELLHQLRPVIPWYLEDFVLLVLQLLQLTPLGTLRSPYTFENLLDLYTLHGPCAPIGPIPPLTTC
ncbi:hypothetical protein CW304_11045 [Bacillus sp. UFRGS-B20]|nr:hypothetical protein CW304_11045 [Bacillus sp. UFRGS-B20]